MEIILFQLSGENTQYFKILVGAQEMQFPKVGTGHKTQWQAQWNHKDVSPREIVLERKED